jgi:hypothetical protein
VDLTGKVRWAPLSGAVVSISPSGFLTVVGFGRGTIGAAYGTKSATQSVTATPAGTFAIAGRVREPAIPLYRVSVSSQHSPASPC